jgi:hypothetical protein
MSTAWKLVASSLLYATAKLATLYNKAEHAMYTYPSLTPLLSMLLVGPSSPLLLVPPSSLPGSAVGNVAIASACGELTHTTGTLRVGRMHEEWGDGAIKL